MQRYLPVANGALPEVRRGASQKAVVDFMFVAIADTRYSIRMEMDNPKNAHRQKCKYQ